MKKILIFIFILLKSSIQSYIEGIDVSKYQGKIDWEKVKIEKQFAIIKMGSGKGEDKEYENNYKGAKAAGVKIGAYYYSYAKDAAGAEKEAKEALELLKGKQFEWSIYYDIEGDALKGDVNGMLDTFCSILKDKNYLCGVYSSAWYLNNTFNSSILSKYEVWVAQYEVDHPSFNGEWGIWQYSKKGRVSGIKGDVDFDYAQINYTDVIMSKGFNNNKSLKCFCYENFLEFDEDEEEDECYTIIFEFLLKDICPIFPDENITEEEIDECELNYFCNSDVKKNKANYLNLSILFYFILFLFF